MYAVGLPVLAGMLAASAFGIFLIPMLYVAFQRMREGDWNWRGNVVDAAKNTEV